MKKFLAWMMVAAMLAGRGIVAQAEEAPAYTYNTYYGASPINWNPHAWEMSNESDLMTYTEAPLVDLTIGEDGVTYAWTYELATAVTDITATFADKEKWGIKPDATERRVFQVDLREGATWADGTPINADTYVYSMKALLDPAMKNYRSNNYISGESALKNAAGYFNNDKAGQSIYTPVYNGTGYDEVADADMLFNIGESLAFFGAPMADYYTDAYMAMFKDAGSNDLYEKYKDQAGYLPLTEELKKDLLTIAANFGDTREEAYKEFCFYVSGQYKEVAWEEVGLIKTGDYQFLYISETSVSLFNVLTSFTSNWIVYEPLYEAGKETKEGLVTTNYGTSLETTMCSGPYKMVSFEKDKQIVLARNENWFGYKDPAHEGQYMATGVKIDIIAEHNTALQLFNQGKLDGVELESEDLAIYRMSDYLRKTDETYTFRWIFATSMDSLKSLEAEANDGANKKVLFYDDFRKAISLSMDRATFVAQASAGFKPAYYLFNYMYYTNIENDPESQYRKTTEAKEAVLNLYGITYGEGTPYATIDDAFSAVTGYDVEEARKLFQSVYEQAIAEGNYTEGQAVSINCMASAAAALSPDDTKQQDLLNQFVLEATKGTGFEGKITFTFKSGAATRYDDVAAGKIEMIRGAWGGAAFYPFSTIRVYCDTVYMQGLAKIHESNGWDPTKEKVSVTFDFDKNGEAETVEKTFEEWAHAINGDGEYAGDEFVDVKLAVLSQVETGILRAYQCIPWGTSTVCDLYSQRLEWATLDYNIMYNYGGLRLLKFTQTDNEWADYVASQGGTLSYE